MWDAIIINYQLFLYLKNFVQKQEENVKTMFFSWFLETIQEMNGDFHFSVNN